MKILRSFEEFLYEIMSWLVFYPRTLFRILRHPVAMADYTLREMGKEQDRQFAEAISPPLTLILSLLLAHVAELIFAPPMAYPHNRIGQAIFGSEQGLLLFRCVCFSAYALVAAAWTMYRTRQRVDRDTLRGPFYIQSYLAAPFAILFSLSSLVAREGGHTLHIAGLVLCIASVVWYIGARMMVYRHLSGAGLLRSSAIVITNFVLTTVLILGATTLLLKFGQ
ncbi:hypothetical protein [Rhodanobacter sp. L36]|uniref:hypothetical protein n=1 Tax=Rhodanobacter sp. L36 TaxID=1747221 RepID=UPI00131B93C1|nr:hypothetical protein [Rhodanobacter sp. L36]